MSERTTDSTRLWLEPGLVWLALLALLGLSVGSAYVQLGALNSPINLAIAGVKVSLIMIFFMHLRKSSALLRLTAGASAFWMLFMFVLMFSDYLSRP